MYKACNDMLILIVACIFCVFTVAAVLDREGIPQARV